MISNSSLLDAGYAPTFDDVIAHQFSVSFWAKGMPGTWNPFVSKRGEEAIGWQVRRGRGPHRSLHDPRHGVGQRGWRGVRLD